MVYKIALASTDGKVVNQHFGRAEKFHIVEIKENEKYVYAGTRDISACCNNGEHEESAFEAAAKTLKDVQAIVVSKIGDSASEYLENKGFVVYEAPYPIDLLMQKIIQEKLYEVDKWQFHTKN